ncbi:MAG TPA: Uma2 family endonuclease [Nitrospiraceae bacterium]|nr:Uma2 family endonuclease [Nitrospiraceae bacterium]
MSTGAVHDPWADPPRSLPGDPPWEVALLYPTQGNWSEEEYLALQNRANLLVELSDGCIEVLPTPNPFHQWIVQFLYEALRAFVRGRFTGHVMTAPLPIRLAPGKYRDPDVIYLAPERITDPHQQPQGADLAMEIVSHSEKDRERDLVIKRKEYAQAGISEYWIVDPREHRITVLTLDGSAYRTHGEFGRGQMASSWLLAGFAISVDAVFAAGQSGI